MGARAAKCQDRNGERKEEEKGKEGVMNDPEDL